ncbi:MAG: GIY-YIG nuclease family protein [Candidatus Wildermuthbacteria bacterium]|nr:GIY-YIG nuclease family protein [Candidatus Wildermuthbacteria bacterium]
MHYVYLLQLNNGEIYTGSTQDLKRRIVEHTEGEVASTKHKRPLKVILYEAYLLKSDAQRREKYLKTTEGKRFLRQQIRDYFKINHLGL